MRRMLYSLLFFFLLYPHLALADKLLIGVPPFSPPFVMAADTHGRLIGFSIEIMDAICKQMGVECSYQPLGFRETFIKVLDNQVDLAIGNITISPPRQKYFKFSLPYLASIAQVLTTNESHAHSLEELKISKKVVVGVEAHSIFQDYLDRKYGDNLKTIAYEKVSDIIFAIYDNDINAALVDKETADYWIANNADLFKVLGDPIVVGQGIGIMANKNKAKLIDKVNTALLAIEADGRYRRIFDTYFFQYGSFMRFTKILKKNSNPSDKTIVQKT